MCEVGLDYPTEGVFVPGYHGRPPIFVAADQSLPVGYELQYDYDSRRLRLYHWDGTTWQRGHPAEGSQAFTVPLLALYEVRIL